MKISGFSFVKNADKLYYPVREAILSVLPLVDEFVIAVGNSDPGDRTLEIIRGIPDPKLKIVETVWDLERYPRGTENAHQTDIAKEHCTGDWLLYLQADEVIHEKYHEEIRVQCEKHLYNSKVEGMLLRYRHFWGDYDHYHNCHGWYPNEIRIIRNVPCIHSWESAQSFRRIPNFDGKDYRQQQGTSKLKVIQTEAYVFHYGWVRPPHLMKSKTKALATIHHGSKAVDEMGQQKKFEFDYGPLHLLPVFHETHPAVMKEWIAKFDWKDQLQYSGSVPKHRRPHRHEQWKYRAFGWIKRNIPGCRTLGDFKNYIKI